MRRLGFFCLVFSFCSTAVYAIGGPAQTKRERREAESRMSGRAVSVEPEASPPEGLREEIERSFLLEDFSAAEKLARDYLTGLSPEASGGEQLECGKAANCSPPRSNWSASGLSPGTVERREVEYLRALCLLKLRRSGEARPILQRLLAGANTERERARIASSLTQTRPLVAPLAPPQAPAARVTVLSPAASVRRQQAVEEMSHFNVQIGSFSKEKNARSLLRQLSERHYPAYIDRNGTALYRVRVGPLNSREEAARTEALLKKDGYPAKLIP